MPQTTIKTHPRIPKKIQIPKNPEGHYGEDIYDVNLDDSAWAAFSQFPSESAWTAFGQSPNDSGASIPNNTATQGSLEPPDPCQPDEFIRDCTWAIFNQSPNDSGATMPNDTAARGSLEPWDSDPSYFDQFIHGDVWKIYLVEMEKAEDAETQTTENSFTVLDGLNVSHSLDTINAVHMPLDSKGVSSSSFSVEETPRNSDGGLANFEWGAYPDRTDLTSENSQHQPEKNGATTGHGTSEAEYPISILGTGKA
jgi:hypothetical protein